MFIESRLITQVSELKKIYAVAACVMAAYFVLAVIVLPKSYENSHTNVPQPRLEVSISDEQILIGESFRVDIKSYNDGDVADLQIVTVSFPQNENLDGVKIISYDFLQSPKMIEVGRDVGAQYGEGTAISQYPFLEAYSRPSKSGDTFGMVLEITPKEAGQFRIYAKSVAMPHSGSSHFPSGGLLDHQNEFVAEYTVEVSER